jgi:hypothetical protein
MKYWHGSVIKMSDKMKIYIERYKSEYGGYFIRLTTKEPTDATNIVGILYAHHCSPFTLFIEEMDRRNDDGLIIYGLELPNIIIPSHVIGRTDME